MIPTIRRRVQRISIATVVFTAAYGLVVYFTIGTGAVWPHPATNTEGYPLGWDYPAGCCNSAATSPNGDCAPISSAYVTEGPDGYVIDLPIGSHPKLKTKGYRGLVPYGKERASPEGNYHICLQTDGAYRYCFFAGARGA
jgi:hypothetical protein